MRYRARRRILSFVVWKKTIQNPTRIMRALYYHEYIIAQNSTKYKFFFAKNRKSAKFFKQKNERKPDLKSKYVIMKKERS